jgi:cellulose biosynthesis protein BcsQ
MTSEADDLLEAKKVNRELLLKRQLKPVLRQFDVVVIDTPPAMRAATINAPAVADSVIIPIDSSSFALLGMNQLLKTIAAISETHNPTLRIQVLSTMYNRRQNLDRIAQIPTQKIISVIETVGRRTPTKINSFNYFVKEILAVPDPRSRTWQKQCLEKIMRRIRQSHVGHSSDSRIDFIEDVKRPVHGKGSGSTMIYLMNSVDESPIRRQGL